MRGGSPDAHSQKAQTLAPQSQANYGNFMDRETPNPSKANSVSTKHKLGHLGKPVQEYLTLQPINYADNHSGTADLNRGSDSSIFRGTNFMQDQNFSNFKS